MRSQRIQVLLDHGVVMPAPETVDVGEEIRPERIAPGAVIHAGCRLRGTDTSIGPGCVVGREQPVTLINCQLGREVNVAGGSLEGATLLDGGSLGGGAHVRAGTLMEEQATGGHTVGFKQTILFPFVTTGSLINFCDCLMAGGTGPNHHSEVGSSFVHFNFTPHGDKATASLIGDVPRGVLLNQPPVFLGGQGGLVGPSRVAFGCLLPAGCILRKDALVEGHLMVPGPLPAQQSTAYTMGIYRDARRIVQNNLIYLGNVRALHAWYREVRGLFMRDDPWQEACWHGALSRLEIVIQERIRRIEELAGKFERSVELMRSRGMTADNRVLQYQTDFHRGWPELRARLEQTRQPPAGEAARDRLLQGLARTPSGTPWIDAVRGLDKPSRAAATEWLQGIVDRVATLWTM